LTRVAKNQRKKLLNEVACGALGSRRDLVLRCTHRHHNYTEGATMFVNSIKRFLVSEDGPTAVEYAVMLALIIVVCLTAIQAVGTNANNKFNAVKNALT
jgi:pilus assembly protein Flp/PilA